MEVLSHTWNTPVLTKNMTGNNNYFLFKYLENRDIEKHLKFKFILTNKRSVENVPTVNFSRKTDLKYRQFKRIKDNFLYHTEV